jgi:hypothetical protein
VLRHPSVWKGPPTLITLSWLLLLAIVGGVIALVDGILRLRGKGNTVLGVIEIIVAALFLLSLFVTGIPFGAVVLGVATIIVLIVGLVMRGRAGITLPIVGIVVLVLWLVLANRWLIIPGIN